MEKMDGLAISKLLDSMKSGDQAAFTVIYNQYWENLYIAAHVRLKDASLAEEVVQNVFFKLWQKKTDLEIHNLTAYLAAMTRYEVYNLLARESKLKEREKVWSRDFAVSNPVLPNIENKLLLKFIRELSNELPERCRLVFIYNKLDDQSLPDVAARMNISQKTAEAHLTKALQFIRLKMSNILFFLVLVIFSQ